MQSTRLGSDKLNFVLTSTGNQTPDPPKARPALYAVGQEVNINMTAPSGMGWIGHIACWCFYLGLEPSAKHPDNNAKAEVTGSVQWCKLLTTRL